MRGHLSNSEIDKYRKKTVTADEVRAFESHLSGCEQCRRSFTTATDLDAAYDVVQYSLKPESESGAPHFAYDELAAYVDGHLDAPRRNIIEGHFESCQDCEDDVAEMTKLRDAIRRDNSKAITATVPVWPRTAFRIGIEALVFGLLVAVIAVFSIREIQALRAANEQLRKSISESEATIA